MSDTKIEWTDRTWNPVTGCTKVSPGCDRCYAEGIARRFAGSKAFPNGFDVTLHPERLQQPLRWKTPARVFVNSMSDLFHDGVSDEFIAQVFAVMAVTEKHTFQVLTKRHGRMRSLLRSEAFWSEVLRWAPGYARASVPRAQGDGAAEWAARVVSYYRPLRNVWLGVSAEDQKRADLRIPALLDTPAAVRFVSAEPLIGKLLLYPEWSGLDWVIVGGESGPGARRMELDWALDVVGGCLHLGIAPFVKQLGSAHGPNKGGDISTWPALLQVRQYPTSK